MNFSSASFAGRFLFIVATASLIGGPVVGAELPPNMMPVPAPSTTFKFKSESPKLVIFRDTAAGLGLGAVAGLGFIAMAPGGLSGSSRQVQGEALATGMIVGLISGLMTGLWETKRQSAALSTDVAR